MKYLKEYDRSKFSEEELGYIKDVFQDVIDDYDIELKTSDYPYPGPSGCFYKLENVFTQNDKYHCLFKVIFIYPDIQNLDFLVKSKKIIDIETKFVNIRNSIKKSMKILDDREYRAEYSEIRYAVSVIPNIEVKITKISN